MRRSRILPVATLVYLGIVALITLTPAPYPAGQPSALVRGIIAFLASTPVTSWFTFDVAEFTANVLMFVPLGALLAAQLPPRRRLLAAVIGLGVSVAIETIQLLALPSRVADVRDLVSNGTGALLGALLVVVLARSSLRLRKDRTAHAR
ncbi:VanZ family protein [Rathayibacter sp. VKM Ac-2856]|uniref:VanZ family protein n=1 Tax=unclassified Rathayibacter TaxID=2609250 RepID=UPI001565EB85|nr:MULTISPECIES: VanZ family protein [unclassified Rathayibacter]NQX06627.1 VanZ family protein [Rathayibacter sp. VKM Ac-2858]NQX21794.1 VanZ family protein [Rathayibacter sp. VKM Ac-2856]